MADQEQGNQPASNSPMTSPANEGSDVPAAEPSTIPLPVPASTGPLAAEPHPAILERLDLLALGLLLVFTFLIGSFAATNSDVWLHLATGQRIAQGEWTVGVDPFSFNTQGVPWVQQTWLYSLLFYLLYNLVGGGGLVVLKALAIVLLALCLALIPGGKKVRMLTVIYAGLAILAVSPQLFLRPIIVSFLLFGVTLLICYRAGALGNAPSRPRVLWRLPLLFMLWANLDPWFIMGPLVLALLWCGTGLGMLLGIPRSVPGKSLGAVLGVGLVACLVNPHHVRVFMLPPELAYPFVSIVALPDFLGAGGRALVNLNRADPDFFPLVSPLAPRYWTNLWSLAGLAYLALLVLGLISIIFNAMVSKKPGAPGLHPGRLLLWAFLAFLSLLQVRLIPWFAIVAAPCTVLNVVDWQNWLSTIRVPSLRPALLGRALMMLVFFVLFFLAWPGWLNTRPGEFSAARRVAWKMPVDPSLHGVASSLARLSKEGHELRVFNFSLETAHYCAWFAPGVKCFMDTRWTLFPDVAKSFIKAYKGLISNVPEAWQPTLRDKNVTYLAVNNLDSDLVAQLWVDEKHWTQKYGDGRNLLFAWSDKGAFSGGEFRTELNRQAFGKVPAAERPPAQGPSLPREEPSFWSLYSEGIPPAPLAVKDCHLWLRYHQIRGTVWQAYVVWTSEIARWSEPAGLGSVAITIPSAMCSRVYMPQVLSVYYRNKNPLLKARDFGPPAALVLMIRAARRAVAESPQDPHVHRILAECYKALLQRQEDYWSNYAGDPRLLGKRFELRQIQIMTGYKTFLDLKPEDPAVNVTVAQMFQDMSFLDVALEYFQQAVRSGEGIRPEGRLALEKHIQGLEVQIRKQRDAYGLAASTRKGLEKYFLALKHGLPKEALEILADMKNQKLSPEEQAFRDQRLIELLLIMGRANDLPEQMSAPINYRAYRAAAVGDYVTCDQLLEDMIKGHVETRTRTLPQRADFHRIVFPGPIQTMIEPTPLLARVITYNIGMHTDFRNLAAPEAELHALRGALALEHGDNEAARKHFEEAVRLSGDFHDRNLAVRYLELLRAAAKN